MAEKRNLWQSVRPSRRRLVQLYSALLYNAHLKGFLKGSIFTGSSKGICVPGLNCYSCPGAVGSCPLGALQGALASMNRGSLWYVLGILMLFGVTLGRTVCGWFCPFGMAQELLHKLPTPKLRKSRATWALSWLKYGILAAFVVAMPLWYGLRQGLPLPAFCKYICPAGTLEGSVGLLSHPANDNLYAMLGALFTRKWVIMLTVMLACVFCYRAFCRFLCPLGAIYGLFNRFSLLGVRVDAGRCNGCGACLRACPMDVRIVGDHECIHCGRCAGVCHQDALSMKLGNIPLTGPDASPRVKRLCRAIIALALALLAAALIWFNAFDPGRAGNRMQFGASAPSQIIQQEKL